jgi:subtilase family serine protease
MIKQIVRFISYSCLCLTALLVAAGTAFAGTVHRGPSPFLAIGPQAVLSGKTTPQYGLFTCQVGLAFIDPPSGEPYSCYDPYQMRHAYGIDSLIASGYNGAEHTIVIVDAFQSLTLMTDLAEFNNFYGLSPDLSFFTQIAPFGLGPPNADWAGEITLDVEWAHAIAPGANIVLVLAKSNDDQDILDAVKYAVDHNLGEVISMSFGENESCVDPAILSGYHDVFASATQKGITLFASSGDQGAAQQTCDGNSWEQAASSPASDPLVTAVGGTELHAAGYCLTVLGCDPSTAPLRGTYQGEIAWNEGPPYGDYQDAFDSTLSTGGGFSVLFDEPPFQKGTAGLHGGKQRAVPDVAYNAAVLHGVLVRMAGSWFLFGGTSAGSPQWAGITAIANHKAGHRLGFLNSAIYQIGKVNQAYPASFNDIVSGTNSAVEFDATDNPVNVDGFSAGTGWDPTTGTGSPIATSAVDYLIRYVSPGDGQAAISTTKPKPHPKPIVPGQMGPQ